MYALAIDLGTTTLATSLIELASGKRLAMTGSMNPQRRFGADVVTRLDAAVHSEEALQEMTRLIRAELWRLAGQLCETTAIPWTSVQQIAIAGNPAMQHILLGMPVRPLAFPPYRPAVTAGTYRVAHELGWEGNAAVYVFPMPGGFVGGDTVAFLLGAQPGEATLCLDMGTNGEMALVAGDTVWATSVAAGPAFEGGNLSCGMAALTGAISSVSIQDDRVTLAVIGATAPVGICGSAAIETVAGLLNHNLIEPGGRLRDPGEIPSNLATRVIQHKGENSFVLHRDAKQLLLLTQGDIRQIQLAKGAIRAGMEVLAVKACIRFQALKDVILTGSFGAVLQPEWLKTIGIFDSSMVQMCRFTPEGALSGVERAIFAADGFASAERTGRRFRVIPLSGTPVFETLFMQHINFPDTNHSS
ncbi:MAG: ASKHA domain-containing protein [Geobacteraceae bacterium]|nr:ASKHA domain-containing protein [Geobacteraceae bacterium]